MMSKETKNVIAEKIPEFRYIPKDWKVQSLNKVSWFQEGPGLRHWQFTKSGMKVINVTNLEDGIINLERTDRHISLDEFEKTYKHFAIDAGDILMASSGATYCKTSVISEKDLPVMMNTSVIRFKPLKDIDYNYLVAYLNSFLLKRQIDFLITGGAQPNFGPAHLNQTIIPLPPISEQTAIANLLITWDKSINTLSQLIAKKELRKKWMMQQLLTGKKRLKGFKEKWKEQSLGYFIQLYSEKPKSISGFVILTSAKAGLMRQDEYYGNNRIANRVDADYNVIPPNYLTYRSRSDDGLFTFNKNDLGLTGLISGYYPVFTIVNGDIDFVLMYMNYFKQKLSKYAIGTSQLVLTLEALSEAKFNLPVKGEQSAIANVLQSADAELNLLRQKLDKLKEQKKGLMQVLLTGKKRLKL